MTTFTLRNTSPGQKVIINTINFRISGPAEIAEIGKVFPPAPASYDATITEQETRLTKSTWSPNRSSFNVYVHPKLAFESKEPIVITTCIINQLLPEQKFTGQIELDVDGGDCEPLPEMQIRSFKTSSK